MSTPYAISTNIGSTTFSGYLNAPIIGPLSTNNYPCAIPYHSFGTLPGVHPNPPQFYSQQIPPAADQFTNSRRQYWRTAESTKSLAIQRERAIQSTFNGMSFFNNSNKKFYNVSTHTNYIPPVDSSLRTQKLRSNAVGKSTYKIGLPPEALYSTKNYYPSGVRSTIKRVRSGGCVAPAKKGAIENTSLRNGMVCAWGAQGGGRPTY